MWLFPSSGFQNNSRSRLGRGVPEQRRRPHATQTEDGKGFKVLGNFMNVRESGTLIIHVKDFIYTSGIYHHPLLVSRGTAMQAASKNGFPHPPHMIGQSITRTRRPYIALHIQAAYRHWVCSIHEEAKKWFLSPKIGAGWLNHAPFSLQQRVWFQNMTHLHNNAEIITGCQNIWELF